MIPNCFTASQNIEMNSHQIRVRMNRIMKTKYNEFSKQDFRLDKPIFMVGMPHSGTSVLASTFRLHPDIAMWTEAPEVWEPYWEEGIDSDYNKLVPKNEDDVEESDVFRIKYAFTKFVKMENKKRLLNKNPRNIVRIGFMRKIFCDAKIIHIYRDPRDVINSITRNMNRDLMIPQICNRLITALTEVEKAKERIPKSDFFEIRYEQFCKQPDRILVNAYDKCELRITDKIIKRMPKSLPNFNGKWKKDLTEKQQSILIEKLGPILSKYNY